MTDPFAELTQSMKAGFFPRLGAALIDGIIVSIAGLIAQALLRPIATIVPIVLGFAYYAYFEGGPSGQTVGKRALGIRVVDARTGGPIDLGRALVRHVGRYISGFVFLLGYLWMLWDKDKQTWHDKIASTYVVVASPAEVGKWPGR